MQVNLNHLDAETIALDNFCHSSCGLFRAFAAFFVKQLYSSTQLVERLEAPVLKCFQGRIANEGSKVSALGVLALTVSSAIKFNSFTCITITLNPLMPMANS